MRRSLVLALILSVYPCAALLAIDLAKIDRPAIKLPELRSGAAQYCLLVFGPDAAKRVWLVRDGDLLYVDRNGNGDLTEPGERVAADPKISKPKDGVYSFRAGVIPDGTSQHKDLDVNWFNIDHMKDSDPEIMERLTRDPAFRGCWISLDVAMADHHGTGIEGRVSHAAMLLDHRGLLEFAPRIEDAPVLHFGGPWEVTMSGKEIWRAGGSKDVYLVVGTPGVGPGTTVCIAYEKVIPAGLKPKLDVTFSSTGESLMTKTYELKRRCCTYNLYGDVAVPDDVATGTAKVDISLENWPGVAVASSSHEVTILPARPGPKLVPVSQRLTSKLQHMHPAGAIVAIQFSPDGKRLIAGDYPGGVVHVWQLATGKRLSTIEMGEGFRGSQEYFAVTPDWQTIVSPTNLRGKFERIEKDGRTLNRVEYRDSIRIWDPNTGSLLRTLEDSPPRGIIRLRLVPGGSLCLSLEEVNADFENRRPRAVSVWDLRTGTHRQVIAGHAYPSAISEDGKLAAVSMPAEGAENYNQSVCVFALPDFTPGCTIPLHGLQNAYGAAFLADGKVLVGTVSTFEKANDWKNSHGSLKFWSVESGEEILSIPAAEPGENFAYVKVSPDGRTIAATTNSQKSSGRRLVLVDWASRATKVIDFEPDSFVREPVFHPSGKWLVVAIQVIPKSQVSPNPDETTLAQPRIHVIDAASGEILETLMTTQAHQLSCAFSPDGKTLATSGRGEVLLWDFRDPPGKGAAATIGQPFEAAGTLVGGKKLDWAAYRGKVVLVTYWATWCKPCVAEIPEIKKTYDALHERGFDVLAVSLDDDHETLERFLNTQEVPWQVVGGATAEESGPQHPLARKYGVESIPKSFLLDRQGNIAAIDPHGAEFLKLAEKLLGPKDEKKVPQ